MPKQNRTANVFNRYVKVYPDRGLQAGVWRVEGEKFANTPIHTYLIKHMETGERDEIFVKHTFRDAECVQATVKAGQTPSEGKGLTP